MLAPVMSNTCFSSVQTHIVLLAEMWNVKTVVWATTLAVGSSSERSGKMKYDVILTKDSTNSTVVTVEADNVSEAEAKALEKAGRYGHDVDGWRDDENCFTEVYATGVDPHEEDEEDLNEYRFEVTGGYCVREDLTPLMSAIGNIVGFKTPDGKIIKLVVALEVTTEDEDDFEYITSERRMEELGLEGLDSDELRFIKN